MFLNRLDNSSNMKSSVQEEISTISDSSYVQIQKTLITQYLQEMNISDTDFNINQFELVDCIKKVTNKEYQKVILIELLGIIYNDGVITNIEKDLLDTIVDTWNINSSLVVVYAEWSKSLLSLYVQGEALLELN